MKLSVFAKKRQVEETNPQTGKVTTRDFYTYISTLVNKTTGEVLPVQVKFRQACGAPDPQKCPCFIEVPKEKANLSWDTYQNEDGEELRAARMWVTEWTYQGEFVDHSLDEFEAFGG